MELLLRNYTWNEQLNINLKQYKCKYKYRFIDVNKCEYIYWNINTYSHSENDIINGKEELFLLKFVTK